MADAYDGTVFGNFDDNDTETDELICIEGGVVVVDLVWTAGTNTVVLQTSIDDGDTYVNAYDANGVQFTAAMATGNRHVRWELLGQPGQRFKLVPSAGSSADVDGRMARLKVV